MGRKHGFESPLNAYQIGAFIFFSLLAAGVYAFFVPCVEDKGAQIALIVVYSLLVIGVIAFYLAASLSDPSDPGVYAPTTAGEFYCALCQAGVGSNSKHCRTCDRCVDGFDHHCKWLNNCIGEKNYRTFFILVLVVLLLLLVQMGWGIYLIARSFYDSTTMEVVVDEAYWGVNYHGWQAALFIYVLLLLGAALMLGELFSFHCVLVMRGMTTYEYIMSSQGESGGVGNGDGKGGARAALCRSTKVADEAVTRQKSKRPKVSLNPCKALTAGKLEGDMRQWGGKPAPIASKDGVVAGKEVDLNMFPAVKGEKQAVSEQAMGEGGAYNHMPTSLRSRSPRGPPNNGPVPPPHLSPSVLAGPSGYKVHTNPIAGQGGSVPPSPGPATPGGLPPRSPLHSEMGTPSYQPAPSTSTSADPSSGASRPASAQRGSPVPGGAVRSSTQLAEIQGSEGGAAPAASSSEGGRSLQHSSSSQGVRLPPLEHQALAPE